MTTYEAVVFDHDGVLVELTEMDLLRRAARAAFEDHGVADPPDALVEHAARGELDDLARIEDDLDLPLADYWASREARAIAHQTDAVADGAKPLYDDVTALADLPHRKAVVSNNQHDTVRFVVDHYGLGDHFEHVAGRDPTVEGARRRKPETHYLDAALDELGTRDAVYVGDSPKDVEVAHRAGVDSAFLRRSHRADTVLDREPTYEVETLTTLAERLTD
ncbi:HAD-superfamily hydrolase [Halosimplex carlsbadense 2-9-1]|uniref:HAD-superfamily hydrolase n=1 Tax=Halosimplex carlsbadense 2-9-1 TaxID=797114 RepID=M0CIR0_9EURY|nr:HAD family hydrolase [Halosimplex carlsbadense]ELZ23175.1 HAD-superfamily hydrolase [Halosimplex carlsbadense 2-9-1]